MITCVQAVLKAVHIPQHYITSNVLIPSHSYTYKPRSCCSNVVITLTASCSIVNLVNVCAEPVCNDIIWPSSLMASLMSRTRNLHKNISFLHDAHKCKTQNFITQNISAVLVSYVYWMQFIYISIMSHRQLNMLPLSALKAEIISVFDKTKTVSGCEINSDT